MSFVGRALVSLVLLVGLVAVGLWMWTMASLPKIDGEMRVAGLQQPVEILRDREGVPHLFAASERDGWYAMGFVHAQDRLWQMDFQRRVASGRLAEFLGERAFDNDRLMRTLGFARLAREGAAKLDAPTREALEAYAAGVNAFLATDPVLPPEFHFFRVKMEPWQPADTLGWLFVMAWDLSGNWRTELARLRYANKLGPALTNEFLPPYPGDAALPLPNFKALYAEASPLADGLLALAPETSDLAVGSNSWALSGARTASGKPLLANDPHLGLQAPSLWYLAHLSTPRGNVIGATLPGVPFVVLGRNDRVAWTMTTTHSDTQDLYIERVAPGDAASYLTPKGKAAFEVREEVIRVGSEERRVKVRATRHGPVISDVVKSAGAAAPKGHVIALAWPALTADNATARAGMAMNHARNGREFVAAARDIHAPQQNIVWADADGRIGMIVPSLVPRRRPDNDAQGRVPVPGWDAKYDWLGVLPFEELPQYNDPKSGRIVTANHKSVPPEYRGFLGVDWASPYRAERIEQLLAKDARHTPDTMRRMQADSLSRLAVELLPVAQAAKPSTEAGKGAQKLLSDWRGEMAAERAAPLVFSAWYRELTRLVYADELGELFADGWDTRGVFMIAVMKGDKDRAKWCDNVRTPAKETCAQLAGRALDLAAADLAKRYGEPAQWRWGAAHVAASHHRPMGFVPVVGKYFNVTPETPGDAFSVNVGAFTIRDEALPFASRHAPSLRAIYDFADLDRSLFMHSTGQSGNVYSPWYDSFAARWARVEYIAIPAKREAIAVAHRLELKP